MTVYQLVKSMPRKLTAEEKVRMKEYIKTHMSTPIKDIAIAMEEEFKTPVTSTCVATCMMHMHLKGE